METKIKSITKLPKHHFFGFHDLPAWNAKGDKLLSLEVDVINRPPLPSEEAGVGYICEDGYYFKLGSTSAYNFPQGARTQWIGESNKFIVNNIRDYKSICDVYDTDTNKLIASYPFACHQILKRGEIVFSINYGRLHRLGAYGYSGLQDFTSKDALPENDGIYIGDLLNSKERLLISINEVANFPEKLSNKPFSHHYLTHLLLNPSNNRLAFLHRYPIPDGGIITRLMTVAIDGSDLRCLATGFLSHFDWKDDQTIFIFGRINNTLDKFRANTIFSLPLISKIAKVGKKTVQWALNQSLSLSSSFLLVCDAINQRYSKVAEGILIADGHPMFCPINRDWIINDTYPDKNGIRTLMLYNFSTNKRYDLGKYQMLSEKPSFIDSNKFFLGVQPEVLKSIGENDLAFTRSGLHCDLHPRWDIGGKKVAFDSIHEGSRQIYVVDISSLNII